MLIQWHCKFICTAKHNANACIDTHAHAQKQTLRACGLPIRAWRPLTETTDNDDTNDFYCAINCIALHSISIQIRIGFVQSVCDCARLFLAHTHTHTKLRAVNSIQWEYSQ